MKERPLSSLWTMAVVLLGVAVAVWFVFDSPLVHGVVLGAVGAVTVLVGAMGLMMRRVKKKMTKAQGDPGPPPLPDTRWDYDLAGTTLDGDPVDFAEYRGQVLVLNLWATWCGPCVAEIPSLLELMERTTGFAVDYAFVTTEAEGKVRPFLEKRGWDLPVVRVEQEALQRFQVRGIPATFVIDQSGGIIMRHVGGAKWDAEEVVRFIQGLAATPE